MEDIIKYIAAIFGLAILTGVWMAVQILAKRQNVKNHIDQTSGCCGACKNKECETQNTF